MRFSAACKRLDIALREMILGYWPTFEMQTVLTEGL